MENETDQRLALSLYPFPSQTGFQLDSLPRLDSNFPTGFHSAFTWSGFRPCRVRSWRSEKGRGDKTERAVRVRGIRESQPAPRGRLPRGCVKQTFQTKRVEDAMNYVAVRHSENVTRGCPYYVSSWPGRLEESVWIILQSIILQCQNTCRKKKSQNSVNMFLFGKKKSPQGIF